jgi:uncharacterized membrane protein YgcG
MPKQLQTPPTDNVDALFQVQVKENQLLQFVNIWLYKHYHKHLSSEVYEHVTAHTHMPSTHTFGSTAHTHVQHTHMPSTHTCPAHTHAIRGGHTHAQHTHTHTCHQRGVGKRKEGARTWVGGSGGRKVDGGGGRGGGGAATTTADGDEG